MTTDTLEFPALTPDGVASEVVDSGALSKAGDSKIDFSKIDLTDVALAGFGDWKTEVANAKKKLTGLVLDMPTQAKVDEFKSLRQSLINAPRAEVRKTSKAIKSKMAKTSKAVGEAEEQIVAAWDEAEKLITPAIEKRQAELDEERARKAAGQAFRVALHRALIARITGYVEAAQGLNSERIAKGVEFVESLTFGDECEELKPSYEEAQQNTLSTLRKMLADAQASEAAEAQRVENERVAAELQAQRDELERQRVELMRQRVASTVFNFPEPEPENSNPVDEEAMAQRTAQEAHDKARAAVTSIRFPVPEPEVVSELPKPEPVAQVMRPIRTAAKTEEPTLKLGEICTRLGMTVTASFLADTLGIQHSATDKAAKLYRPSDFPRICDALIAHVQKAKAETYEVAA